MIGPQASLASPGELTDSGPRVTPTPGGLRVVWHAGTPQVQTDSEGSTHVTIPGYELLDLPGVPRLPFSSVLVALPPDSKPVLQVITVSQVEQNFEASLALGSLPEGVERDSTGRVIGGSFSETTEAASNIDQAVTLEPSGVVRGVHLARLSFYPVVQNGDMLRVISSLEVEVDFGPVLQGSVSVESTFDPVHDLLRAAVVNPEQMQIAGKNQLSTTQYHELQANGASTVAVEVSSRGITDISGAELAATGISVSSFDLANLSLSRDGSNIAYQWFGDDDSIFEPGEIIRFFADPRFSRWSTTDTYLLDLAGTSGVQMSSANELSSNVTEGIGIPWAEIIFEENSIYTPGCYCAPIPEGRDGDRWVWDQLLYTAPLPGKPDIPVSKDYKFQVKGLDNSHEATLKIWLIGQTDHISSPDHQIDVYVNGNNLGTRQWDGKNAIEEKFTFSASNLNEGENTLTISLSGIIGTPIDGIWLDAFSIRYALANNVAAGDSIGFVGIDHGSDYTVSLSSTGLLVYDITNPEQPEFVMSSPGNQVTISDPDHGHDHEYWVTTTNGIQNPSQLRSMKSLSTPPSFGGAVYVIIAPEEFIPSLDPLVALHQSDGLQVVVEDVQAIYDVYGGGRSLPNAIRDFLKGAYDNWDIPPLYVLLVGDGTHDPKNYQETSSATFIPPFLEVVDPWAGETAADNRYVTVDPIPIAEDDDTLPDMLIGRLPANNISELDTMVSKIVDYAEKPIPEPWQHQVVFVADNNDFGGGNFPLLSDTLINKLPSNSLAAQRLYYSSDFTPGEFRTLVNQVWDDGNGLIMFTGHSSIHQWAHEILFHLEDVPGLDNGGRLPVVLEMTCFTGSFQIHDFPTLDEDLLRQPGGGAVAVWGATGLGIATGHHWLAEGFMETIYRDGISEIGSAALAGKLNLAAVGSNLDLIDTFTLLGDPATKLERSYQIYVPITKN